MKTLDTNQLLDTLEQKTEHLLTVAISKWQMLADATLCTKPANNGWSATECLLHLNSYGDYYLPALQHAIEKAKRNGLQPKATFKSSWLGNYFTNLMKPKEKGAIKKMQSPKNHRPLYNKNGAQVVATFIQQQETLLSLLKDARLVNLERTGVPISIAKFIKLSLGDVFQFYIAHHQRHVLQAERAIEAALRNQVGTTV